MIMQPSEIVLPPLNTVPAEDPLNKKLRQAYLRERKSLEHIEIELNRSKIVVVDQNGRILRLAVTVEH